MEALLLAIQEVTKVVRNQNNAWTLQQACTTNRAGYACVLQGKQRQLLHYDRLTRVGRLRFLVGGRSNCHKGKGQMRRTTCKVNIWLEQVCRERGLRWRASRHSRRRLPNQNSQSSSPPGARPSKEKPGPQQGYNKAISRSHSQFGWRPSVSVFCSMTASSSIRGHPVTKGASPLGQRVAEGGTAPLQMEQTTKQTQKKHRHPITTYICVTVNDWNVYTLYHLSAVLSPIYIIPMGTAFVTTL